MAGALLRRSIGLRYRIDESNWMDDLIGKTYSEASITCGSPAMTLDDFLSDCLAHLAALAQAS